jgi:transcriptional regulator with XRE-family HTH domain
MGRRAGPAATTPWAQMFKRLLDREELTQRDVSEATGLDRNTLSGLLHGREAKSSTLVKLAEYFHIDPGEFLRDEQEIQAAASRDSEVARLMQALIGELFTKARTYTQNGAAPAPDTMKQLHEVMDLLSRMQAYLQKLQQQPAAPPRRVSAAVTKLERTEAQ